jgi:hypothetical protein
MQAISAKLKKLMATTNLIVYPEDYIAAYLPTGIKAIPGEWFRPATTLFAAVIQEPKLVTMIMPLRKWRRMQNMFDRYEVSVPLKVITFDVKHSLSAGGFRVAVASLLAEADISSIPISSFKLYHIVVPKTDLPRSVRVLRKFLDSVKKRNSRAKKP